MCDLIPFDSLEQRSRTASVYGNALWRPASSFIAEVGARLDALDGGRGSIVSPRLSLKYFLTPDMAVIGNFLGATGRNEVDPQPALESIAQERAEWLALTHAIEHPAGESHAFRGQIGEQQKQILREFAANSEDVLAKTGDLLLLDETDDTLLLRSDGRFETSLDLSDRPEDVIGTADARRPGLMVTEAKTIAAFYDPADVLHWVTEALAERYPAVDFTAVYE